jgi:hypothetical protein
MITGAQQGLVEVEKVGCLRNRRRRNQALPHATKMAFMQNEPKGTFWHTPVVRYAEQPDRWFAFRIAVVAICRRMSPRLLHF